MQKATKFKNYIKLNHYINNIGILSSFILLLLTLSILIPINLKGEKTIAASGDTSTTSLTLSTTSGSAELDLLVTSDSGTFASSTTPLSFSASTNNYTGYTLSIKSATSSTNLTNSTKDANNNTVTAAFTSLSSTNATTKNGITATTFNSSTYNNQWGFKPSYYNSVANSNNLFYPSPDSTGVTLNRTNCANGSSNGTYTCPNSSDSYTIAIGARATYAQVAGTYTNKYILSAVGNYPQYSITYTDLSSSASNMPSPNPQSITSVNNDSVSVALSGTEPTRTGYTFSGWCIYSNSNDYTKCPSSNNGTNNTGTKYSKGANYNLDLTNSNTIPLYAVWTVNQYDCVKRYRLQKANGTWDSYNTESTTKTDYNTTCSYSKTITDYKASASGANNSQASTSGTVTTSGVTLSLDFYRNTFALTVNRNTSYIQSASATTTAVHSSNYYRWGQSVAITATASSGNKFTSWSQSPATADVNGTFANASSASTSYTMPKSNVTVTANGAADKLYMWNATSANCGQTLYDNRDGTERAYTTKKIGSLCWMTTNLMLGKSSVTQLTSATSNVDGTYNLPASSTSGFYNNTDQNIYNSGNTSCGNGSPCYGYYTYAAATAGKNPSSGVSSYDICPANWRLPARVELANLVNSYSTGASLVSNWSAVYSGAYYGGSFYDGGSHGNYWSSAAVKSSGVYYLQFTSIIAGVGDSGNRNGGLAIRCVAKS